MLIIQRHSLHLKSDFSHISSFSLDLLDTLTIFYIMGFLHKEKESSKARYGPYKRDKTPTQVSLASTIIVSRFPYTISPGPIP